ncbi:MAG: orotate phosphoribosyltransferase [Clostridiales Family XIII bacterium]|jgi:orotate phosphoribosyltransferase|nr:orotate phosphoribosyltransferase [Clostridiales Family XIII bacterium]
MNNYKEDFIKFMVKATVLRFGSFVTKSGRTSPYFVNTGLYRTGEQIMKLGEYYAERIKEAMDNGDIPADANVLFGPAYKGIPLAVTAAIALKSKYNIDVDYCFNRKVEKDHGEGGSIIGHPLEAGDKVIIIDDVITAGTAMRETIPVVTSVEGVEIAGLIVSVDRMEKGTGELSAIQEIERDYGIKTYPIVTIVEILDLLAGKYVDGKVHIDDEMKAQIEAYRAQYCV